MKPSITEPDTGDLQIRAAKWTVHNQNNV